MSEFRIISTAGNVHRDMEVAAHAMPRASRAVLRNLAVQAYNQAQDKAQGSGAAAPGAYPIPMRTGYFHGAFGFEVGDDTAVVFNSALYAVPLHDGFKPYGNPHAAPIPGRPYFDDALNELDIDAAHAAFEAQFAAMQQLQGFAL